MGQQEKCTVFRCITKIICAKRFALDYYKKAILHFIAYIIDYEYICMFKSYLRISSIKLIDY